LWSDCDGLDDNCDGTADNNYVPTSTSCGVGVCASTGTLTCTAGSEIDSCTEGSETGDDSDCDGLDDDCNGVDDDNYIPTSTSCGVGVCASTGTLTCTAGSEVDSCTAGPTTGDDSDCDGLDDDCDGTADDNYVTTPTSCGTGVCASTGTLTCDAGSEIDSCTEGSETGDDSDCDGLDDNCDGTADENYISTPTSCGVGECASTGTLTCDAGSEEDSCTEGSPETEICTGGLDEDCDGLTDAADPDCGVTACGNGILEYPEQCEDGNTANGDGCSATCTSEPEDSYFDEIIIIDNGDGTYTYQFMKDGVAVIEIINNNGLINLKDFDFEQQQIGGSFKIGLSMDDLILSGTTKSITIPMRNKICSVDDNDFRSGSILGNWGCWFDSDRIIWATHRGNDCRGATSPVQAKDKDGNYLPGYTCQEITIGGQKYAKLSGFAHTTLIADDDEDGDNVPDDEDRCLGTILPESVPTRTLRKRHFANVDTDGIFETRETPGGPIVDSQYDLVDTFGCTCEQILECKPGQNRGEYKFGCSIGTMKVWTNQIGWAPDCQRWEPEHGCWRKYRDGDEKDFLEDTDQAGMPDIIDGDSDNDGVVDDDDDMEEDADEEDTPGHGKPDWWCRKHPSKC